MVDSGVKLFFSYSHKDEGLRDKLATHLSGLEGQGIISGWHDRKLTAGMEWDSEIKSQIFSAEIILLLISPDFIASKYCRDVEIPRSLKQHEEKLAYVVPVILRPFYWSDAPFAKLQAFPKDAKPVTTWANQDEAFVSVTKGIRIAVDVFLERKAQRLEQKDASIIRYVKKVEEILSDGEISIIERDTLDELREELGLTAEEAQKAEARVYEPYKRYRNNLNRYQQTLVKVIDQGLYPFSEKTQKDLELRQRDLGLKEKDIQRIEKPILAKAKAGYERNQQSEQRQQLDLKTSSPKQPDSHQRQEAQQPSQATDQRQGPHLPRCSDTDPAKPLGKARSCEFEVVTVNSKAKEISRIRRQAEFLSEDLGSNVLLDMVFIPGGEFWMGTPQNASKREKNEQPRHQVTVQSFFMGKFPVTQAQWRIVAGFPQVETYLNSDPARFKGENLPVEQVSWYEAVEFCKRLTNKTGRTYRLSSEAEWEYACRAGSPTLFHFGEALSQNFARLNSGNILTFHTNALLSSTADVGSFGVANNFGLYDMHGNVCEWCEDHWHDSYQQAPLDGCAWLSDDENQVRVSRGGAWDYPADNCRSAFRIRYAPEFRLNSIGFRVAMTMT